MAKLLFLVGMFIQGEQLMDFGGIVILDQIYFLLLDAKRLAKMPGGPVIRVLHQTFHAHLRAMGLKLTPQHLDIGPESVKGIAG